MRYSSGLYLGAGVQSGEEVTVGELRQRRLAEVQREREAVLAHHRANPHYPDPSRKDFHVCVECEASAWQHAFRLAPFTRAMFAEAQRGLEAYLSFAQAPPAAHVRCERLIRPSVIAYAELRQFWWQHRAQIDKRIRVSSDEQFVRDEMTNRDLYVRIVEHDRAAMEHLLLRIAERERIHVLFAREIKDAFALSRVRSDGMREIVIPPFTDAGLTQQEAEMRFAAGLHEIGHHLAGPCPGRS